MQRQAVDAAWRDKICSRIDRSDGDQVPSLLAHENMKLPPTPQPFPGPPLSFPFLVPFDLVSSARVPKRDRDGTTYARFTADGTSDPCVAPVPFISAIAI
jgi:hypothetical protein